MKQASDNNAPQRVRIDKWLWAARFFKTRSLAKAAIESGKVQCNGERCKGSRDISAGMNVTIRQGYDDVSVVVKAVSEQRRGAPEAALLYEETPESKAARELAAARRRAEQAGLDTHSSRPTKQDRRMIHRMKRELLDS